MGQLASMFAYRETEMKLHVYTRVPKPPTMYYKTLVVHKVHIHNLHVYPHIH